MAGNKEYRSDDIIVIYDPARCIHVANCVHGVPAVFNPEARPWIQPEKGTASHIADVVQTCPTGALHFERLDGGPQEQADEQATIAVQEDGPLYLRGEFRIIGEDGALLLHDTRIALCRCGGSSNKPFCDGAHARIGFRAG